MLSTFLRPFRSVIAIALALLSASSFASTVTYTSSASFLANVAPGAYTENFDGLDISPPTAFASGGFSFDISAPSGLYASSFGGFLGTSQIDEALTITFGAGVTAFGANFFSTDLNDDFQVLSVTLTLSDGTVETFMPNSLFDSYRGFTSDLAFTSLVISAPGQSLYAGLDNLTVGTMPNSVPEPTSLVLAGLALAGLLVGRRQRLN